MRVLSWNLYHGRDFPPDPALFTLRSRLLRVTERNETHVQVNRSLSRELFGLGDPTGPDAIDHLLARGLEVVEPPRPLPPEERELPQADGRRLRLSDHAPVVARWEVGSSQPPR